MDAIKAVDDSGGGVGENPEVLPPPESEGQGLRKLWPRARDVLRVLRAQSQDRQDVDQGMQTQRTITLISKYEKSVTICFQSLGLQWRRNSTKTFGESHTGRIFLLKQGKKLKEVIEKGRRCGCCQILNNRSLQSIVPL